MVTIAGNGATKRRKVGIFTPEHKQWSEPYGELLYALQPIKERASKTEGTIRTRTGGLVDFWSLNDNELAGRGREYDHLLIDEAAFTKDGQMLDIWQKSIEPTILTKPNATVWVFSTPNGNSPDNFFWKVCNEPKLRFKEHYAPSIGNPLVTAAQLERYRLDNHPLVFQQEYLAEFVDWTGVSFFELDKLLVEAPDGSEINGKRYAPVDYPTGCDSVFLVIDTAVKGGKEHDGTAASWWAHSTFGPHPLVCLDWELIQVDAALLERILPRWLERGEELARQCRARYGFTNGYIEDAASGSILLQQAVARGMPVEAVPEKLTAAGKDGRAINASGAVYRGEVKFSRVAYDKNDIQFKGSTRNHMVSQVVGFRIGDKKAATRADDLLDTFCNAVAISLGDSEGIA